MLVILLINIDKIDDEIMIQEKVKTSEVVEDVIKDVVQDDVEMLHHCAMVTNNAGLQLLDWVVIGRGGLYCPRSIAGMPDPWSTASAFL